MSQRAARAALLLVSSLTGLAVAEWVARRTYGPGFRSVVDPYEHHPYRPYTDYVDEAGLRIAANALGWKDRPSRRMIERDPSPRRRVVLLGDSFTEGMGLPAEQTIAAYLEEELNRGGRRFEVLNGGRVSYSPLLEYQRLKRFLARGYAADVVVVLPDLSDVMDEIDYSAQYRFATDGEPLHLAGADYLPPVRWVYNHFALVRWVRRQQLRLQGRLPPAEMAHANETIVLSPAESALLAAPGPLAYADLTPGVKAVLRHTWFDHPPSVEGWANDGLTLMRGRLAWIHRLAERRGMQVVVAVFPWPGALYTEHDPVRFAALRGTFPKWFGEREMVHGLRPSAGAGVYREAIRGLCRERSIPFVDLFPAFAAHPDWPRLYLPGDVHFGPRGCGLAARELAAALRRHGAV